MKYITGDKLKPSARKEALASYGYRWTFENKRRATNWHGKAVAPRVPLVSDSEWLESKAFAVRKDGQLDARTHHCVPAYTASDA